MPHNLFRKTKSGLHGRFDRVRRVSYLALFCAFQGRLNLFPQEQAAEILTVRREHRHPCPLQISPNFRNRSSCFGRKRRLRTAAEIEAARCLANWGLFRETYLPSFFRPLSWPSGSPAGSIEIQERWQQPRVATWLLAGDAVNKMGGDRMFTSSDKDRDGSE